MVEADRPAAGVRSDAAGHPSGRSRWLSQALDDLWRQLTDDGEDLGLLPRLDVDAVLARARRDELRTATPRLLQLVVDHDLDPATAAEAVATVGTGSWEAGDRVAIERLLDAWWRETLERDPDDPVPGYRPGAVLGVLCGFGSPMVRWFEPWLNAFDGPGAQHLADIIVAGPSALSGVEWDGKADAATQVFGWARTEPVVTGLALVGGVHLDPGLLGDALDRLI